jgi:hypothetical protein
MAFNTGRLELALNNIETLRAAGVSGKYHAHNINELLVIVERSLMVVLLCTGAQQSGDRHVRRGGGAAHRDAGGADQGTRAPLPARARWVCRSVIAVRYTRRGRAQIQLVCEPPQSLCVRAC